jgi:hypothetical protein
MLLRAASKPAALALISVLTLAHMADVRLGARLQRR